MMTTATRNLDDEKINVLLVEDDRGDMDKLASALEKTSCFNVYKLYDIKVDITKEIKRYRADIVSLDLDIEGDLFAQPLIWALRKFDPSLGVGVVTWHETFKHYLESLDFFVAKNWSESGLDKCIMSFKISALYRVLSRIEEKLYKLIELKTEVSIYSELNMFTMKLSLLASSNSWQFELPSLVEFVDQVKSLPETSHSKDILGRLYNTAAEFKQQIVHIGVQKGLLNKRLEKAEESSQSSCTRELEDRYVRRYTDIIFPVECLLGKKVTLSVQLRVDSKTVNGDEQNRKEGEVKIVVFLSSKAFDIIERNKFMVIPYDKDSERVEFPLIPKQCGEQAVSIEFFKATTRVGYIIANTFVKEK
jgi:hypothetical protein